MDDVIDEVTLTQRVIIKGRVQGVGFRSWVCNHARKLGLTGFVRNRSNGDVEAIFHGPQERVEKMIRDCWDGPLISRVTAVEAERYNGTVGPEFLQAKTV